MSSSSIISRNVLSNCLARSTVPLQTPAGCPGGVTRQKSPHPDGEQGEKRERKKKKFYKKERKEPKRIAHLPQRLLAKRPCAFYRDMGRLLRAMSQLQ